MRITTMHPPISFVLLSLPLLFPYLCTPLPQRPSNPSAFPDTKLEFGSIYNTSGGPVPDKINVHLVAHTHDDVGWLKTVDQYFVGSNNSIQVAAVQYILDSVIAALRADENRKYIYVEQAFFQRWWKEQTRSTQKAVEELVESGQLEFINGGWCMHDEAATHYIDMIDQTTLGHRFIKEQFNKVPRIGWQIDPFGHSAVQAYLLGAEVGFDAVFFARADYQDVAKRRKDRTMEVIWRGSKSFGPAAQIFAGVLAAHYGPPTGFNFDIKSSDPPVQDDPFIFDNNVQERIDLFVEHAQQQSKEFRTNHIMWTMGDDFAYEYANTWFKQLDKLIHYVNLDGRVNTFYSTPSTYLDAKHAANETWPVKTGDYFPYADKANSYWTGYFSSRAALKGYVRKLSGFLQAARQLEFIVGRKNSGPNTDALEESMAVLQHHDGVSGTEKQHVTNDYAKRLFATSLEAAEVINSALAWLIRNRTDSASQDMAISANVSDISGFQHHNILLESEGSVNSFDLHQCPLLNISYCPLSEANLTAGDSLVIVVYNPLGWEREEFVRITVSSDKLVVLDSDGRAVPSQIVPVSHAVQRLREKYVQAYNGQSTLGKPVFTLVFKCYVPPLGYSSYFVKFSEAQTEKSARHSSIQEGGFEGNAHIQSDLMQLVFSNSTGQLIQLKRIDGTVVPLKQSYCWYNGSDGNTESTRGQASGAYIFRPNSSTCYPVGSSTQPVNLSIVRGPLVEEVHQQISPWVSQVIRLYKDSQHAEIEFMVGPIPIDDGLGKEVVTKLESDLKSGKEFYTDSNGRDFLKRVRDFRTDWDLEVHEEIAGNYYPLNSGIYLKDNITDFSILVDRAVGGSSIVDGELELMLHRRLLHDDGKGVDESLNESVCIGDSNACEGLVVQGLFFVNINTPEKSSQWRRSFIQRILSPLQLAFIVTPDEAINQLQTLQYSMVLSGYQLPPNVAIITLQELPDTSVLLRLAHLYEIDEDKLLSTIATIDLRKIFGGRKINEVVELSLSANQRKSNMRPLQWQVEGDEGEEKISVPYQSFVKDEYVVEISAMEIKTFHIHF